MDAKFQINQIPQAVTYAYGYNGMVETFAKGQKIFTATNLPGYKFEPNATNYANLAKVYYNASATNYDFENFYRDLIAYADGTNAKSMIKDLIADLKLDDTSVPLDERLKKWISI